jgi:cyclase
MTASHASLPSSRYFHLERVGGCAWLAIATPGSGALGNAGIIDLGGATLIFDTMMTLSAARDLRAAAEALTGRAPRYVVNSHFHLDHTAGNAAFDGATLIASAQTATLTAEHGGEMLRDMQVNGPEIIARERAELATITDPAARLDAEQQVSDFATLVAEANETRLRLPDITFDSQLTIQGAARQARLITWGGGHTPSDVALYLPEERILFTGDLIFYRMHASIFTGDGPEWLRILGEMDKLDIDIVAPGHGIVAPRAAIAEQRAYLETVMALAQTAVETGKTADEAAATPIPERYRDWGFASGFSQTMRVLFTYHQRAKESA